MELACSARAAGIVPSHAPMPRRRWSTGTYWSWVADNTRQGFISFNITEKLTIPVKPEEAYTFSVTRSLLGA
jgi:hypothetical protein